MIVIDTDVVSELMRATPDGGVAAWGVEEAPASFFLSAISEAGLRYGVVIMAAGQRRDRSTACCASACRRWRMTMPRRAMSRSRKYFCPVILLRETHKLSISPTIAGKMNADRLVESMTTRSDNPLRPNPAFADRAIGESKRQRKMEVLRVIRERVIDQLERDAATEFTLKSKSIQPVQS